MTEGYVQPPVCGADFPGGVGNRAFEHSVRDLPDGGRVVLDASPRGAPAERFEAIDKFISAYSRPTRGLKEPDR
ncbi:hypothetical protein [Mycobacterium seoulense]|uniref:hypothetical protein n=1 Tax=Mycobacterium seoulense TaxID=386911 RepID=UPI003CF5CA38